MESVYNHPYVCSPFSGKFLRSGNREAKMGNIQTTEFRKKKENIKKEERMRVKPKSNYKGKLFDKRKKEAGE